MSGLQVAVQPLLDPGAVLLNLYRVQQPLSEKCFVVINEEMGVKQVVKGLTDGFDVHAWIDLPSHTNIVTCYD